MFILRTRFIQTLVQCLTQTHHPHNPAYQAVFQIYPSNMFQVGEKVPPSHRRPITIECLLVNLVGQSPNQGSSSPTEDTSWGSRTCYDTASPTDSAINDTPRTKSAGPRPPTAKNLASLTTSSFELSSNEMATLSKHNSLTVPSLITLVRLSIQNRLEVLSLMVSGFL